MNPSALGFLIVGAYSLIWAFLMRLAAAWLADRESPLGSALGSLA